MWKLFYCVKLNLPLSSSIPREMYGFGDLKLKGFTTCSWFGWKMLPGALMLSPGYLMSGFSRVGMYCPREIPAKQKIRELGSNIFKANYGNADFNWIDFYFHLYLYGLSHTAIVCTFPHTARLFQKTWVFCLHKPNKTLK